MLPSQFKRLIDGLRSLTEAIRGSLGEAKKASDKQETAIRDATKACEEKERKQRITIARAIIRASATIPKGEQAQRDKEYSLQWKMFWVAVATAIFTALAFAAAAVYAGYAKGQLAQMIEATKQAKRSADLAACALRENQRQFHDTLQEMQAQTAAQFLSAVASGDAVIEAQRTSDNSLKESERILGFQTRPWLDIVIQSVGVQRMPDPEQRKNYTGVQGETQWRAMAPRKIIVKYSIHNYGGGPAIQQMSRFTGEHADNGSGFISHPQGDVCPTLQSVGGDEQHILYSLEAVFPGNETRPLYWPSPTKMNFDEHTMRIVGCVVYRGPLDNGHDPRAVHTTEIETLVHTSPYQEQPEIPKDNYTIEVLKAN